MFQYFWLKNIYRRLLETLSSNKVKKLKISKTVRYRNLQTSLLAGRFSNIQNNLEIFKFLNLKFVL